MRTGLTIDDIPGFLDEPIVAVLATLRKDGSVLLSPVWHEWRDGGFTVWIGGDDVKADHLRRDPRATIVVAESSPPYRGVEVRTAATFVPADVKETAMRIASRYLEDAGHLVSTILEDEDVVVRMEPGALRVWDFSDEYDD